MWIRIVVKIWLRQATLRDAVDRRIFALRLDLAQVQLCNSHQLVLLRVYTQCMYCEHLHLLHIAGQGRGYA